MWRKRKIEEMQKIRICCLTNIGRRLDSMRRILLSIEKEDIIDIKPNSFSTSNAVYTFVNCYKPEHAKGILADQVIIDFREPMRSIAKDILRDSCVPEAYQIIDDREIGASDS